MPYTIDYSTSSKTAIVVNDGTVDTTTSLSLIGKNYTYYRFQDFKIFLIFCNTKINSWINKNTDIF